MKNRITKVPVILSSIYPLNGVFHRRNVLQQFRA